MNSYPSQVILSPGLRCLWKYGLPVRWTLLQPPAFQGLFHESLHRDPRRQLRGQIQSKTHLVALPLRSASRPFLARRGRVAVGVEDRLCRRRAALAWLTPALPRFQAALPLQNPGRGLPQKLRFLDDPLPAWNRPARHQSKQVVVGQVQVHLSRPQVSCASVDRASICACLAFNTTVSLRAMDGGQKNQER